MHAKGLMQRFGDLDLAEGSRRDGAFTSLKDRLEGHDLKGSVEILLSMIRWNLEHGAY